MKKQAQDFDLNSLVKGIVQYLVGKYDALEKTPDLDKTNSESSNFGSSVLAAAKADLGFREDLGKNDGKRIREYFKNFGMGGGQDWCAAAVSTWMKEAGGGPIKGAVGARNVGEQFRQAGKWVPKSEITPEVMTPGNIVVWSRGGPDSLKGHIGVINSFDGKDGFTSVEGNSGPHYDSVVINSHSINDSNLLGVGILSDYIPKEKSSVAGVTELADKFYKISLKSAI